MTAPSLVLAGALAPAAAPAASAVPPAPLVGPATGLASLAWLLIAVPAAGAAILLLAGRACDRWGHLLGLLASLASACLGLGILAQVLGLPPAERTMVVSLWRWFGAGDLEVRIGLRIDPLSLTFVALVTFVGFLIHVYSVAYMAHDRDRRRFFAYLNLFIAAMLTLVLGDSYIVLFVGWEGVGLASYLLIGFWNTADADAPQAVRFTSRQNATAAKKAFIMNRVGDVGLLLAMMAMVSQVGSVSFISVLPAAQYGALSTGWLTAIGFFLLLAACGKSAQFPLQAWLGDAMAGPTPVSALIHAATMVTAGVYLMVRSGAVFQGAPGAQLAVAVVGAITLVLGAVIGSAKDDMKKVLAASTMSQIGYMMLGAGLGPIGYAFAIFHLLTHGFFKAQLFLGAGSVMHAMGDQVDMRRFGALARVMRVTWVTMGVGWLAILGIPPLSGFWSKDRIIEAAFTGEGARPWVLGTVALLGAGLTAFYMSRLFFMIFHGRARWTTDKDIEGAVHPHESGWLMTAPLIILSVFSLGLGGLLSMNDAFVTWLEPVTGHVEHGEPVLPATVIMGATLALVLTGVLVAWLVYARRPVPTVVQTGSALVRAARRDMYQDAINEGLAMRPGQGLVTAATVSDRYVVDGAVEGLAKGAAGAGRLVRRTENGYVRSYAGYMLAGTVLALIAVLASRF
ncbi:NADH-quinone oxidoreductase subunit L [Actinomyces israelii]|uniref:NADH-quinone oxidoreductase subunit L n=1 Tax=Actinomyces israelii TaxID=1659 RepID=A0ABT4I8Q4_9ACTO|nr:NADH-quinone oxidoreductase subunit L [Actinomyces israelii]MCZ0858129.1 NADH-quinone oxidoreductase subunit L [Actinomyces israelii]WKR20871.1 NADH-quinone oxidoreductase subunit L [Actinomyces israelii]